MFYLGALVALFTILSDSIVQSANMGGSDLSLNRYTDDGELAQITYAGRFLSKCSPAVGFTAANGKVGVLLRVKRRSSPLLAKPIGAIERAYGFSMCIVGLESDCSRARRDWYELVESDLFTFGELPSLEKLTSRMSAFFTRGLYQDNEDKIARPLAASTMILQSPSPGSPARLRVVRNTGLVYEGVFATLGSVAIDKDALERLADVVEPLTSRGSDLEMEGALASSIDALCGILLEHLESKGVEEGCDFECAICRQNGDENDYFRGSREAISQALSSSGPGARS